MASFYKETSDSDGTYSRYAFQHPSIGDYYMGQYSDTSYVEIKTSLSGLFASMGAWDGGMENIFSVEPRTIRSSQYPNSRDENELYLVENVLYTDRD